MTASLESAATKIGATSFRLTLLALSSCCASLLIDDVAHAGQVAPGPAPTAADGVVRSRHRAPFPVFGIEGLADDRFLLWHGAGWVQIGTASGQWGQPIKLAIDRIGDVQREGSDILILGSPLNEERSAILLLDATGKERTRWVTSVDAFELVIETTGRSVSTRGGYLVPLLPAGTLGAPERLVGAGPSPSDSPPDVVVRDDTKMVLCRSPDRSKAHRAPGRCERTGDRPWRVEGQFRAPWVACGDWFVAADVKRSWNLSAYSMATGQSEMRIATSGRPAFACISAGELIVGDRMLSVLRLPSTKPIWRAKVTRGRLTGLAVTENAIAFQSEDSPDVVIIPRPRPRAARSEGFDP